MAAAKTTAKKATSGASRSSRTVRGAKTPGPKASGRKAPARKAGASKARDVAAEKPTPKATSKAKPKRKATAADQKLARYRSMRDFGVTPEPAGGTPSPPGRLRFLVQKHAASHLHFDFRLEHGGVLWSWAVPKGPSWTPTVRRLAMQTEDHPLDYADFEGIIPEGEYGGGTVMLWDQGTWTPDGDPEEMMRTGRLTFELHGERMKGRWHLVRSAARGASYGGDGKRSWLLFKGRDAEANDRKEDVAERDDRSVVTGRRMAEIAKDKDRTWRSNRTKETDEGTHVRKAARRAAPRVALETPPPRTSRSRTPAPAAPGGEDPGRADPSLIELVGRIPTSVRFTNLDKVLFAGQGLTKAALVAYYAVVAEAMLPHLAGRPLTLVRCPNGAGAKCFFQKHRKVGEPEAIRKLPIREESGAVEDYMVVDDRDGLFACAQVGALELHVWGSHEKDVEKPSRIVFDLDPDEKLGWGDVVTAAKRMRAELAELGLETFVMTTGGKGLHVIAPLAPRVGWDETKQFTKDLADRLAEREPTLYTTSPLKVHRRGRIFLDYLRNGRGATAVCPFSTRARPHATVAAPITWEELDAGATGADFTVQTMPRRLDALERDPWEGYFTTRQQITAAARRAVGGRR